MNRSSRWWALFPILVCAFIGAIVGGIVGHSLYTPDPDAYLDFGDLEYTFWGTVLGMGIGACTGWLAWLAARLR